MNDMKDPPIDDIIKSIRAAIIENRKNKMPAASNNVVYQSYQNDDVFELTKSMLVKREDLPYQLGVWNFDDVAKKMLKKYRLYFTSRNLSFSDSRVRVKEVDNPLKITSSL